MSDVPGCGGWEFAQAGGIPVLQLPSKNHPPGQHAIAAEALSGALQDLGVDFICLAGFLKVRVPTRIGAALRGAASFHLCTGRALKPQVPLSDN